MFIPNTKAQLRRRGPRDVFGKEIFATPVEIPCAVVQLKEGVMESSVRADSSASRGAAEELMVQSKILIPNNVTVKKGDVLEIYGIFIEVMSSHPRINVLGDLDHYELTGTIRREL